MGYSKRHLIVFEEQDCIKNRYITVTFIFEQPLSDCASKNVVVRLSDEDDLYFLFTVRISDKDFSNIKIQQGLLVDFDGFSQRVIDLLELCRQEESSPTPKYVLKFSRSFEVGKRIGVLRIIEATNFKYLTHLSLNLCSADDDLLKTYLVDQLKNLRVQSTEQVNDLKESLERKSLQLSKTEQILMETQKDFEQFKLDADAKERSIEFSYKNKITNLENQLSSTITSYESSALSEKRLATESIERMRSELLSNLTTAEQELKKLKDERAQLKVTVSEMKEEIQASYEKNASLKDEISGLRSKLESMEVASQNQTNTVSRLEARISALENDLSSKDNLLSKTQDLLVSEQEQKSRCQEQLQRQTRHVEKLEKSLEKESEEVKKANEIIRRLQTEVKSNHTKAKLRGQVAAEQERLLSSKETELQELHAELDRTKSELKTLRETVDSLNSQLKVRTDELTEAQKTIKTNENIIGWLNRQISENQMGQMQQRLKSTPGFPTPIPAVTVNGTARPFLSPAMGSATGSWQPTNGTSANTNVVSTTTTTANFGLHSGGSAAPGTYASVVAAASLPTHSTLPHSTESNADSVYNRIQRPIDSVSQPQSLQGKLGGVRQPTLPIPMTKSTPLHADHILGKLNHVDGPARTTSSSVAWSNTLSSDANNRLPTYVPSVLTLKAQHQPAMTQPLRTAPPDRTGIDVSKPMNVRPGSSQDDCERTLHQQSLSSAYFPKPIGAQAQR